jgi:hypothetical protein
MADQQLLDADYYLGPSGGSGGGIATLLIPEGATLKSIQAFALDYIEKIKLTYEQDGVLATVSMGDESRGGAQPPFEPRSDEFIIAIRGTYDRYVNTLELITNKATYGPWGAVKGRADYRYDIPPGMRFAGIVGRSGLAVDAIGVIVRQHDERRDEMSKWGAIAGQVAGIAANLIPSLFNDAEAKAYQVGDVVWLPNATSGEINAFNVGGVDSGISYAVAGPNTSLSVYQPLPSGHHYDAKQDLEEFKDGQITIGREVQEDAADVGGASRTITLLVKWLAIGAAVRMVNGIEGFYEKKPDGSSFRVGIRSTSPPIATWFARVQATDARGGSVSASSVIKSEGGLEEPFEYFIDLPPGVDLDPIVQQLEIELKIDEAFYIEATRERRGLVRKGRPA